MLERSVIEKGENNMKIIDLTHVMESGMPVFPGTKEAIINDAFTLEENGFNEKLLNILTHTGTHLDCPKHMLDSNRTTDTVAVDHFYGSAWVFDCRASIPSGLITPDMIDEKQLSQVDFALIYTGWDKLWGKEEYFRGFPTFSEATVERLIKNEIKAVGLDFISADRHDSTEFTNHKKLLNNNCLIVENLTGLEILLNRPFTFSCFPLKIKAGDGSPVRAVGIFNP